MATDELYSPTQLKPTMHMQQLSDEEKAEKLANKIRDHFPNFLDISINDRNTIRIKTSDHSYYNIGSPEDKSWTDVLGKLKPKHRKCTIEQELEEMYDYLNVLVNFTKSGTLVSVWIKSRATGLGSAGLLHKHSTHTKLANLNQIAREASEDDKFYCSGHEEVEPKENYSYYYFAGKYCEEYKEENPDHYRKAMNESYS